MEYQKITNVLDATSDNVPRFIIEKWREAYDQPGSAEDRYKPRKQIRFKTSMLRSDLWDYSNNTYIAVKDIVVKITLTKAANKNFIDARNQFLPFYHLKTMHHLLIAYQNQ